MRDEYTAIIQLREPARRRVREAMLPLLRGGRGVRDVVYEPLDALIAVRYDGRLTGLADLVRSVEDGGARVSSVARRTG